MLINIPNMMLDLRPKGQRSYGDFNSCHYIVWDPASAPYKIGIHWQVDSKNHHVFVQKQTDSDTVNLKDLRHMLADGRCIGSFSLKPRPE